MIEESTSAPTAGRERVLDATESCLQRFVLAKTTLEDVAKASGLSRATVYRLFGKTGMPADKMPAVDKPVHGTIGYHIRSGKHNVTDFDWEQYLNFADKHFGRK